MCTCIIICLGAGGEDCLHGIDSDIWLHCMTCESSAGPDLVPASFKSWTDAQIGSALHLDVASLSRTTCVQVYLYLVQLEHPDFD